MTTTTFSAFFVHLDWPSSTQLLRPRTRSVHQHAAQVPSPTHPNLSSPRSPTSDSDSRIGRQLGRFQEEITFLWGRRGPRLRSGRQTTSPLLPSRIQYLTPRSGYQAVHLETQSLVVNDGGCPDHHFPPSVVQEFPSPSPPNSSHSDSRTFATQPFVLQCLSHAISSPLLHLPLFRLLPLPCPTYAVT